MKNGYPLSMLVFDISFNKARRNKITSEILGKEI